MDKIRITKTNAIKEDGKVSKKTFMFKFTFQAPGTIKQVVDYLISNRVPKIASDKGVNYVSSRDKGEGEFERVMTSQLPNSTLANTFIGSDPVHVTYEGAYDSDSLVLQSKNNVRLDQYFKFTDILIITEENGVLTFDREARVFNATNYGIKGMLVDGAQYEDFFNQSSLAFYYGISQDINS